MAIEGTQFSVEGSLLPFPSVVRQPPRLFMTGSLLRRWWGRRDRPTEITSRPVVLVAARGDIGGAERVLLHLLERVPVGKAVVCAPAGSELATAVTEQGHAVRDLRLSKYVNHPSARSYLREYFRALRTLVAVLRKEQPSVVHGFAAFTAKVVIPASAITRVPAVIGVHEITTSSSIGRLRSHAQRLLAAPFAASFVAVSSYVADSLISSGYPPDRIHVVHNGITRSTPRVPSAEARAALGLPSGGILFLVVARLSWWKGVHVAVDAFARYSGSESPPAQLVVVGGPAEPGDEKYENSLRARALSLGVSNLVHFFGPRGDVELFYDACDVVLVPSVRPDPFPTVVLEAGLAGRAAIVTAIGGAPEAVVDGVTGIVAEPSAHEFASAMERSVDAAWYVGAGKAALHHVETSFDLATFAAAIQAHWRDTAGRHEREGSVRGRVPPRLR